MNVCGKDNLRDEEEEDSSDVEEVEHGGGIDGILIYCFQYNCCGSVERNKYVIKSTPY